MAGLCSREYLNTPKGEKMKGLRRRFGRHLAGWLLVAWLAVACQAVIVPDISPLPTVGVATPAETAVPAETPTAFPAPPSLTLEQLQNGVYLSDLVQDGKVTLTNGRFKGPVAGTKFKATVTLAPQIASGDLNGDGLFDAAVILATNTGGTGIFRDLHAVLNQQGQAVDAAAIVLGDRVQIKSLAIQEGEIVVDMMTHGPKDALCCPTVEVVQTYKLQGNNLVLLSVVQKPTIQLAATAVISPTSGTK